MPKYLVQASYTTEGIQSLVRDSASGRRADVQAAVKTLGGKVEAFYYAFGDDDVVLILDLPNNIKAAAVELDRLRFWHSAGPDYAPAHRRGCGSGLEIKIGYRAPGGE